MRAAADSNDSLDSTLGQPWAGLREALRSRAHIHTHTHARTRTPEVTTAECGHPHYREEGVKSLGFRAGWVGILILAGCEA